ncbi:MAG: hypothetical protein ACXVGH_02505, partial [Mycobacteriales bacterium]
LTSRLCTGGCPAAVAKAFSDTVAALTAANGTATESAWTGNTATKAAGTTMPLYDAIHYAAVGVAGQPVSDWQNRPTFQQVVMYSAHRPRAVAAPHRATAVAPARSSLPATGASGLLAGTGLALLALLLIARRRWRTA